MTKKIQNIPTCKRDTVDETWNILEKSTNEAVVEAIGKLKINLNARNKKTLGSRLKSLAEQKRYE